MPKKSIMYFLPEGDNYQNIERGDGTSGTH